MRVGRVEAGGEIHFCEPDGDGVRLLVGSFAEGFERGSRRLGAGEYRQLSPVQPRTLLVVLGAFPHGTLEEARQTPAKFASKLPSTVIAPGDAVVVPPEIDTISVEPELAVVMGKRARRCSPDEALAAVFGYVCFNDVTHMAFIREQNDVLRGKSIDTFGPCGPWIDTDLTEDDVTAGLALSAYVNDTLASSGNTKEFTFRVGEVVAEATRFHTLEPGDVISLGTPYVLAIAKAGDTMRIEVEKLGSLANPIVAEGSAGGARP